MNYTKTILPNGVRVITVPMDNNPTVTVMVTVGTGSYYEEPKEAGLSHFLEHMCFKGTTKRPSVLAITTELDSMGAVYNAFTSNEVTGYYAKADVSHFDRIADIIVDIYKNSIFPEGEIKKEKGVVMGEIDMYADDPQEKVADAIREHVYKGETAERHILGTKETVGAITRDDLVRYRNMQYKANNTVITIAGGVDEIAMIQFVNNAFNDMEKGDIRPEFPTKDRSQAGAEVVIVDKDTDQAHIVMMWRTFDKSNPNRFPARIINGILRGGLSSRLFIKLRDEMGSGYYIHSSHDTYKTFGHFSISTGTLASRVPEIVSAIIGETKKLIAEPVPGVELEKVKELIRSRIRMSLETSDGVADFFAEQEMLDDKIRTPEELDALFQELGPEEIMRAANMLFDRKKLTVAVIGKDIDRQALEAVVS